jgi:hypothetical protein
MRASPEKVCGPDRGALFFSSGLLPACLMLWYNKDICFPLMNLGGLLS